MKAQLHRIQVLRFVAASMVLFGHVQHKASETLNSAPIAFQTLGHAAFWASGVDVFFVISGFIMYVVSREDFGRPKAPTRFFLRRLARVVPSYWLATSAMVVSALLLSQHVTHSQLRAENVLASYFFIPSLNAYGDPYPVLALGWTLNFEMLFYVAFALALMWPRALGLTALFGVLVSFGMVGAFAPRYALPMALWFNPIVFEFLFGVLLGCWYVRGRRWSAACGASLLLLSIVLLYLGSTRSEASPFWPGRALWMGLPAALLCASAVLTDAPTRAGPVGRFFALLGDASYAMYLTHPFSLAVVLILWQRLGWDAPWSYVGVSCALTLAVALSFHLAFERPVVVWLGIKIKRERQLPLHAVAAEPGGRS